MKRALIIEDDELIRSNVQDILRLEDYTVESATDGLLGLRAAQQTLPELIICDIMMPGLDGYGVLQELRRDPLTATIPFIFLTALSSRDDLRRGMELGANDYVTKPFTSRELLTAIEARLALQNAVMRQFQAKLDALRDNLTLMMPHELRIPLVGILAGAELLRDDWEQMDRADINNLLNILTASGRRMAHLVENRLLYAELTSLCGAERASTQAMLRQARTPNARAVIEAAARNVAARANRAADLSVTVPDVYDLPMLDQHLDKIIAELVDNACKFSPAGTPISIVGQSRPPTSLSVSITDQGRGLTPAQIADIGAYQQFERRTYEQQGAGLGLTLVRLLAEAYGGSVHIDSRAGGPTIVQVALPALEKN